MSLEVRPIHILLVEDSPTDVELTMEALKDAKLANTIECASDGEEAMARLRRQSPFQHARRPDLVLLDLNLPRKDGREVLCDIKDDPALKAIPVVVLTTSAATEDILGAYNHHANAYVRKPIDFEEFTRVVSGIHDFWVSIVTLPPHDESRA